MNHESGKCQSSIAHCYEYSARMWIVDVWCNHEFSKRVQFQLYLMKALPLVVRFTCCSDYKLGNCESNSGDNGISFMMFRILRFFNSFTVCVCCIGQSNRECGKSVRALKHAMSRLVWRSESNFLSLRLLGIITIIIGTIMYLAVHSFVWRSSNSNEELSWSLNLYYCRDYLSHWILIHYTWLWKYAGDQTSASKSVGYTLSK